MQVFSRIFPENFIPGKHDGDIGTREKASFVNNPLFVSQAHINPPLLNQDGQSYPAVTRHFPTSNLVFPALTGILQRIALSPGYQKVCELLESVGIYAQVSPGRLARIP